MGKFSIFVNAWAVLWTLFVSIIFILPTVRPVAALTMNYAAAFLGLIALFAVVYWYISGRKFYTGPLIEAVVDVNDSQQIVKDNSSGEYTGMDTKERGVGGN